MSKHAFFYNSVNGDRKYDANSFSDWLRKFFTTGVFVNDLQVLVGNGMQVTVQGGYCNINGKVMMWDESTTLSVRNADATQDRIDTVVAERNDTDRDFFLKVVTGKAAANPAATAPVRSGTIYQLVLAQIYVKAGATTLRQANITDKRSDTSVCGIVAATVKEMDFSQFAAQFQSYYDGFKSGNGADFDRWFNGIKGQVSADTGAALQLQMRSTVKSLTLRASSWSNGTYTISDSLITESSNQEVIPATSITAAQYKAFGKAMIVGSSQRAGSFTLKALGSAPTVDIPVQVIYRGIK